MLKKGLPFLLIGLLLFSLFISGCSESQFNSDYKEFKNQYMAVTDLLDYTDPWGSIEKLNSQSKINQINKLKELATNIEKEARSDREKKIYEGNVTGYYDGVKYLLYAAQNKDKLTIDERGRIATELTFVEMRRNSIEEGEIQALQFF